MTAFGRPVVPLEKLKYPHTSLFLLPGGSLYEGTCCEGLYDLPIAIRSCTVEYPSNFPSSRNRFDLGRLTELAAAVATSIEDGAVNRNLESAVLIAYDISSTLYAGEAPEIFAPILQSEHASSAFCNDPPAFKQLNMTTGYHTEFWLKSETVSPSFKPYLLTRAVQI
jgi:hypothetical protein